MCADKHTPVLRTLAAVPGRAGKPQKRLPSRRGADLHRKPGCRLDAMHICDSKVAGPGWITKAAKAAPVSTRCTFTQFTDCSRAFPSRRRAHLALRSGSRLDAVHFYRVPGLFADCSRAFPSRRRAHLALRSSSRLDAGCYYSCNDDGPTLWWLGGVCASASTPPQKHTNVTGKRRAEKQKQGAQGRLDGTWKDMRCDEMEGIHPCYSFAQTPDRPRKGPLC